LTLSATSLRRSISFVTEFATTNVAIIARIVIKKEMTTLFRICLTHLTLYVTHIEFIHAVAMGFPLESYKG
jgi:hypothetical protein